ncbi:MAG: 4Fe-4S binding protein [Promethearchaeota archaeon]
MSNESNSNENKDKDANGEEPKIAVFVCHCGHNIAGVVDVKKVVESVKDLPNVIEARDYTFMCSKAGVQMVKDAVKHGANRTVVASCSKAQHGPTFSRAIEEEGLNKHLHFQANIREHCSWVHKNDKKAATEKAIKIVTGAINRARKLEPVETKKIPTTKDVMVIGAGIAGCRAAMDIANLGIHVHLVERESSIGGHMTRLYKTFPTNECPQCSISPLTNGVANHPNITLYTYTNVKKAEGSLGNFDVVLETKPRYVKDNCTSCGECEAVCPVEVPAEWDKGMSSRKAIYKLYPQAIPSTYVRDKKNCIECMSCVKACPVQAIDFSMKKEIHKIKVGSIVLAAGYEEYDPTEIEPYHYGDPGFEDVITELQLERIMNAGSLTDSKLLRPSDGKVPKKVVFIQCVGSRNDQVGNEYCTGVCCMMANKNAGILKDDYPDMDISICYIDMRTPGLYYEEYYKATQKKGVRYIRGRPAEIEKDPITGQLRVIVEDTFMNEILKLDADLVVLSAAMVSPKGIGMLGSRLQVLRGKEGFIKEYHLKMNPTKSSKEGIYIAGAIQGPKDITMSVAQAGSAAVLAAAPLVQGYIEKEMFVPEINKDLCVLCGKCVMACPASALKIENGELILNEGACKSCGLCYPACPTGALQMKNYREDQLHDEVVGLIMGPSRR